MDDAGPRTLEPVESSGAQLELASAELAYRLGIVATSRVIQPSLASFLR